MLLPFVRELFAEVQQLPAFTRASSHLRESAGRVSVTGLSPAAKALVIVLLRRTVEPVFGVRLDARCGSLADHISFEYCEDPIHMPQRDCWGND